MEPWCWLPARGSTEHSMTTRRQGPQLSAPHSRLQHDGPARPHRGCPEAVKPKPPDLSGARPKASLSASNNWGSLLSRSTSIFTEGLAVTSGVVLMHIEPWEGALLPRRTARLLEGAGGPPGRWNPGCPFWSLF